MSVADNCLFETNVFCCQAGYTRHMTIELDPAETDHAPTAAGGLRERKKLRTRAALVDAALDLFERQGFEATTVDQIAAAVDVSPRTFFRYFATKEDVILAYKQEQAEQIMTALRARPANEPIMTALRACADTVVAAYDDDRDDLDRLRRGALLVRRTPALLARALEREAMLERMITAEIARRLRADPETDLRPRLAVAVAIATMRAVGDCWTDDCVTGMPPRQLRAMFDEAFALLATGLNITPPPEGDPADSPA